VEQDIDSEADPQACRRAVKRLLELEQRYGITATYNVVGKLFREQPDLIEWIVAAGAEVAFHSYHHFPDWQPTHYSSEPALCRELSASIKGYRSPRSRWDEATLTSLLAHGFLWNAESDSHPVPYFIHGGIVRLPIAGDDWPVQTGKLDVDEWIACFREHLRTRRYFGFGSHDTVTSFSPEERLAAWERILQIIKTEGVLAVTFSEAADLFRRSELMSYYNEPGRNWNERTKELYRTRRFQELIRQEAETLERPVVVDLGSGGAVLTAPLVDIAAKVICVDNCPGMLTDADPRVTTVLQDVTDTGLPQGCADLIVCARVIEYLYWPDRLAEEMRRIARPGAIYFVTFPAVRDGKSPPGSDAPDRIRHYFRPEEIRDWSKPLGEGVLLGIQYDPKEPANDAEESRYRTVERELAGGGSPTNWVLVGRVA
jgi:peptidoglycan/xylan/chitin deacetylase (PgdA/CDA1 family)/SAM-dependent methyltransferase